MISVRMPFWLRVVSLVGVINFAPQPACMDTAGITVR